MEICIFLEFSLVDFGLLLEMLNKDFGVLAELPVTGTLEKIELRDDIIPSF